MGFFAQIKHIFNRETEPTSSATVPADRYDIPAPMGSYFCAPSPMHIAAVYRCVNVLADSVANLPMQCMKKSGDIFVEDGDSELYELMNVQPSPTMSAVDFWQMIVRYLLLRGNAYIIPVADRLHPELVDRLVLVAPESVSHDTITDTYVVNDLVQGISGVYDESDIIHIKNYSLDGKTGLSTLSYAAKTSNIASTADDETLSRFSNGGGVRGLVSNASSSVRGFGEYQDDELRRLSTDEHLEPYLNFVQKNKRVLKLIHQKPQLFRVEKTYLEMQKQIFYPAILDFVCDKKEAEYKLEYYTRGVAAIVGKWMQNNCDLEIKELIDIIKDCVGYTQK